MPVTARDEWLRLTSLLDSLGDEDVPCRGSDPEARWPDGKALTSDSTAFAIDGCRRCPAAAACLDYALAADERYGIWAGTLPDERRSTRLRATA